MPSAVVPSMNVTVPVGVPAPGALAVTVAVKETSSPLTDGLTEDASVVVVLVGLLVRKKPARVVPFATEAVTI